MPGIETALIARPSAVPDNRTTALLGGFDGGARRARGVGALPRQGRGAARDPADRRHSAGCCAHRKCRSTPRKSTLRRSATISRTGTCWQLRGARLLEKSSPRSCASRQPAEGDQASHNDGVELRLAGRLRIARGAAGRRRRRPPSLCASLRASPSTRRVSAVRAELNFGHARPHHDLDRISHRERAVHAGAPARHALEPGLRGRSRRGRALAALDAAALSVESSAAPFDPRQGHR